MFSRRTSCIKEITNPRENSSNQGYLRSSTRSRLGLLRRRELPAAAAGSLWLNGLPHHQIRSQRASSSIASGRGLMGTGLVRTPGDFGLAGLRPEDPELLDWLAGSFMARNWSVKQLVRQIVLSATYQQVASFADVPEGLAYAVRQPRRLTAEQLRDSILSVSGLLTNKSDGPAIWPDLPREVLEANPAFLDDNQLKIKGWYPSAESDQTCRSIFLIQKRNTRIPLLESFDQPDNSVPCARRATSIVAPQAISMLNGDLNVRAARAFANRVEQDVENQTAETKIARAFALALQRKPTAEEQQACARLLEMRSLPELCRVLLNLTEFAYVD